MKAKLIKYTWTDLGVDLDTILNNETLEYSRICDAGKNAEIISGLLSFATNKPITAFPNKKTLIIVFDSQENGVEELFKTKHYKILTIYQVKGQKPICDISLRNRNQDDKIIVPWK